MVGWRGIVEDEGRSMGVHGLVGLSLAARSIDDSDGCVPGVNSSGTYDNYLLIKYLLLFKRCSRYSSK